MALACLMVALAQAAAAAEQVRTRAWAHSEFGRIVFDWPAPVQHSAEISGDTLTIKFSRPFTTSWEHVRQNLGGYITSITTGADGASAVVRLHGSFRMRSFVNDGDVVVDLAARPRLGSWGATVAPPAPPKPEKPAPAEMNKADVVKKAETAPKSKPPPPPALSVRTGKHAGFRRMVFDWTRAVGYRVSRDGRDVEIRFDRKATIDTERLRGRLAEGVSGLESSLGADGLRVALRLPRDARVRHFRDGTRVVVDILGAAPKKAGAAPSRASNGPVASGRPVSLMPTPGETAAPAGTPSQTKERKERKRRKARKARSKPREFGPMGALVTVDVARRGENELSVTFNWRREVGAAVYRRHENIWVFFDTPTRVDLGGLKIRGAGIIDRVIQHQVPEGAFVGLTISDQYAPTVHRDGTAWILDIAPRKRAGVRKPIAVTRNTAASGAGQVVLDVPEPRESYRLRDPEIGDIIGIVTVKSDGYGIPEPHRFVDFTLFASALGVAYRPLSETLRLSEAETGIVISIPGGLNTSRHADIIRSREADSAADERPLWNIAKWRLGPPEQADEIKNRLIAEILQASPSRRNDARINLAKFHLAHGMAADAIGVVDVVMKQNPSTDQHLILRSIRAAASYLLRHHAEAAKAFAEPDLDSEPGARPWVAAIAAARGDWQAAHDGFGISLDVTSRYPAWLRRHFLLLAAEAALVANEPAEAEQLIKLVGVLEPTGEQRAEIDYLRGHLLRMADKPDDAMQLWETVIGGEFRRPRAKATFARIETLLRRNEIDRPKAISSLEELAFAWRGDVFEFDLLRRIGELYIEEGEFRKGLARLRQAASYFEQADGAQRVTQLMTRQFKDLYLDGKADALPPITALALFEEFRELTPAGADGDEMIRKLADRLTAVDLLGEAADLLSHQIGFRLAGEDKSRVGTRLAAIRMLDGQPDKALAALESSEVPGIPDGLAAERRRLRARVLGELGRPADAIAALGDDYGFDAERLRLGVLLRAGEWKPAADVVQRVMSKRKLVAGDEETARMVLQWAIALAMAGDGPGIAKLRDRFGPVMTGSAHAKAYQAIVGNDLDAVPDYPALIKAVGDLDALKAFLEKYRTSAVDTARLETIN